MSEFPKLPLPQQVGPYQVKKVLSKAGNMARIFEGLTAKGKRIAVKISRSDDPTYNNLLRQEVVFLEKMRHPGVVHIYPIKFPDNPHVDYNARAHNLKHHFGGNVPWYYAMEFLSGGSLEDNFYNGRLKTFPAEWKIELVYRVALALHHVHARKAAHLDVNMKNIMFRTPPDPARPPDPVLIDFGLTEHYNREPLVNAGTLAYASPDRVEGLRGIKADYRTSQRATGDIDHRPADVWALGVIAYELLMGKSPFMPVRDENGLAVDILYKPIPPTGDRLMDQILIGDPKTRDAKGNCKYGMLSKVAEERLSIMDAIYLIDTQSPYPPPRISM